MERAAPPVASSRLTSGIAVWARHADGVSRPDGSPDPHPLDNAVWAALTSHQAHLCEGDGSARRFDPEVSAFAAIDVAHDQAWAALADLASDEPVALFRDHIPALPAGWVEVARGEGHQLVLEPHDLTSVGVAPGRPLTGADVPAMLDLVAATTPGPFLARTIELGRYHGAFESGRLVAMAGERLHLDGFTEISAVCTHPDARGRGLAATLTRTIAVGIIGREETPFLHVARGNDTARRVYERLGFRERRIVQFVLTRHGPQPVRLRQSIS